MTHDLNPSDYHVFYGSSGRQGIYEFFITTIKLREVYDTFRFYLDSPKENGDYEIHETKKGRKKVIQNRNANHDKDCQRLRNPNKVDEIIDYMKHNKETWVFSSVTASCDTPIIYQPTKEDGRVGKIMIRKGSNLLINDGQHRADAIGQIWNANGKVDAREDFGEQSVSVVIYQGQNLKRMQQMFIDLQKGTLVNKSLAAELSGNLDNRLVREVRDAVPLFKHYVVSDQTSIAKRSRKLFTLKVFYDANKYVFGTRLNDDNYEETKEFLIAFWSNIAKYVSGWEDFVDTPNLDTDEFRESHLCHLSVTMHGFGMIASKMFHDKLNVGRLERLRKINFRRTNKQLAKLYGTAGKLANNPNVRMAIRDYLWGKVLEYKKPIDDV